MINRRRLITLFAAYPTTRLPFIEYNNLGLISANKISSKYFISVENGLKTSQIPINFQPHGILRSKPSQLIVIGKRPSDLLAVVDLKLEKVSKIIRLPYGRHFWGHGVVDTNTQTLFTTEYDFENENSTISEWNIYDLKLKSVFPSRGISGHDLIISGNNLICANGGFVTSPEFDRMILSEKINSTLTFINKENHDLIASIKPPSTHMSFRHLCQTKDTIFAGLQNKTKQQYKNETVIVAIDKSSLELTKTLTLNDGRKGYITSINNVNNNFIVATSHVNNAIYIIDAKTNALLKILNEKSPQGIQVIKNKCYVTIENGVFEIDDQLYTQAISKPNIGTWQNHCLS